MIIATNTSNGNGNNNQQPTYRNNDNEMNEDEKTDCMHYKTEELSTTITSLTWKVTTVY